MLSVCQKIADQMAIGLSLICLVHCLLLPILLLILPQFSAFSLESEVFHAFLLLVVVPISLFALGIGCRDHRNLRFFMTGIAGLLVMVCAVLVEQLSVKFLAIDEIFEKIATLTGAIIIAYAHVRNYQLCRTGGVCCQNRDDLVVEEIAAGKVNQTARL